MILNPELGAKCWIITDYWEKLYALHVEIVDIGGDGWEITCKGDQMQGDHHGRGAGTHHGSGAGDSL